MRRADRLFGIMLALRRRPVVTAAELAEEFEVSERTIYRDIDDLSVSGVPVRGEAGVGYMLEPDYFLPAMSFTPEEIEALVLGAEMVVRSGDASLAEAANSALARIRAVLPASARPYDAEASIVTAPNFGVSEVVRERLAMLRQAAAAEVKVRTRYAREDGTASERVLWPIGIAYFGRAWTLAAWCELREDFRAFRLDRFETLEVLAERYPRPREDLMRRYVEEMGDYEG